MVIKNKVKTGNFFITPFTGNKRNKHGWTSILEVFASILLIAGIITLVVNSNAIPKPKLSEQIYKEQALTLKIIQMDDVLRGKVIGGTLTNEDIKNVIPDYLECEAKICVLSSECNLEMISEKEIYAKSILITTDMNIYDARELKLFCWEK